MEEQLEVKSDGIRYFAERIWIPVFGNLRELVMDESYKSCYSVHPGFDKMYHDLKVLYWWPKMKADIATGVSKCLTCAKVKVEYQQPSSVLHQPKIPMWKREQISMDLIIKLPRTPTGCDAIWHTILKLMAKQNILFKLCRISVTLGSLTYRWWSSPTTTVITLASKQLHLRHYTDINATLLFSKPKLGIVILRVLNSYSKSLKR
ncbi:hypothetical protein L1987_30074 [Smallanthus sonchifolius]|uniref:Uncharacterized protein n=1 Tax=Smallanthus sonchifolius TaxID=185202 RepID=A0ACB9I390_9ASTR|nr:hypothetical protein L1987_30074 [Smallanthus sonchifolius]